MVEAIQNVVMRLAMCGLGVSLAAMALRSRPIRAAVVRLLAIWRGLTAFGRFAVCSFLLVGILVGGDKTNSVNNLLPQMGEGLTNGLYKYTATIHDDPPETVQLVVGDLSVAVTNAGEYCFNFRLAGPSVFG